MQGCEEVLLQQQPTLSLARVSVATALASSTRGMEAGVEKVSKNPHFLSRAKKQQQVQVYRAVHIDLGAA